MSKNIVTCNNCKQLKPVGNPTEAIKYCDSCVKFINSTFSKYKHQRLNKLKRDTWLT